jgi:two-component system LytT family sensor kinase
MDSPTSDRVPAAPPYWLLIAAASLVPAMLGAFTTYLNSRLVRGSVDWTTVTFSGALWLIFGALTPIAYVLARRFPLRRERIVRIVAAHIAGALALCVAWTSMGVLLAQLLIRRPVQEPLVVYYF